MTKHPECPTPQTDRPAQIEITDEMVEAGVACMGDIGFGLDSCSVTPHEMLRQAVAAMLRANYDHALPREA